MNDTVTPLIIEHEGSRMEISDEGITLSGPSIRLNSGPANTGDKVFQFGAIQVALGEGGVRLNGDQIVLPASANLEGA